MATFLISCKDNKTEQIEAVAPTTKTVESDNAASEEANVAVAINPAHGQPGHRCDLPVGAPLNGSNSNTSGAPLNNSGSPVQFNSNTENAALNPAHGQPGHNCDIKVGAPLPKE